MPGSINQFHSQSFLLLFLLKQFPRKYSLVIDISITCIIKEFFPKRNNMVSILGWNIIRHNKIPKRILAVILNVERGI